MQSAGVRLVISCPGHCRLPDGELLRIDWEMLDGRLGLGLYVAAQYWPDCTERRHVHGELPEVTEAVKRWAAEVTGFLGGRH